MKSSCGWVSCSLILSICVCLYMCVFVHVCVYVYGLVFALILPIGHKPVDICSKCTQLYCGCILQCLTCVLQCKCVNRWDVCLWMIMREQLRCVFECKSCEQLMFFTVTSVSETGWFCSGPMTKMLQCCICSVGACDVYICWKGILFTCVFILWTNSSLCLHEAVTP